MLISLRRHETCEKQTSWLVESRGLMPLTQGYHGTKAILLDRATGSKILTIMCDGETIIAWFSISRLTTTDNACWLATLLKKVGSYIITMLACPARLHILDLVIR